MTYASDCCRSSSALPLMLIGAGKCSSNSRERTTPNTTQNGTASSLKLQAEANWCSVKDRTNGTFNLDIYAYL